ncbi:hypothetical protein [Nitrosomonas communis]|uniref:Uncharacterized protein n=1 Tax=Nitrosomonas communis TaxID=44574 RepID=A0A1I4WE15_9PROT|nr:hypothetical protein [Nitrosomonas communis]SFN11219.1 hypothetical protein SAMN05421863_11058 [Nitrosomonas communis]
MIDHLAFRLMILDLVKIYREGAFLKLIAIDARIESGVGRDEWMAKKLLDNIGQDPLLALLGNLHTLKKVQWNISMTKKSPFVAEILASQRYNIKTYPQIWLDKTCNTRNRFIASDEVVAIGIINNKLISLLNASEFKMANDIVDEVVLWECD